MNLLGKITKTQLLLVLMAVTYLASISILYAKASGTAAGADYTITTTYREPEPVTPQAPALVDLNTAALEELQTLSGIGAVMAQRIIDYRTEHGPFTSVDELLNVKGIGEAALEKFRDRVTVSAQGGAAEEPEENTAGEPEEPALIDLNTAGAEELQTLNGIGEVLAQRIIDYRAEHGPFTDVDELLHVKGIGEATLEQFRDQVAVSPQDDGEPTDETMTAEEVSK